MLWWGWEKDTFSGGCEKKEKERGEERGTYRTMSGSSSDRNSIRWMPRLSTTYHTPETEKGEAGLRRGLV